MGKFPDDLEGWERGRMVEEIIEARDRDALPSNPPPGPKWQAKKGLSGSDSTVPSFRSWGALSTARISRAAIAGRVSAS